MHAGRRGGPTGHSLRHQPGLPAHRRQPDGSQPAGLGQLEFHWGPRQPRDNTCLCHLLGQSTPEDPCRRPLDIRHAQPPTAACPRQDRPPCADGPSHLQLCQPARSGPAAQLTGGDCWACMLDQTCKGRTFRLVSTQHIVGGIWTPGKAQCMWCSCMSAWRFACPTWPGHSKHQTDQHSLRWSPDAGVGVLQE